MGGALSVMAGVGGNSGGAISFTPSPGSYQVADNGPGGVGATFTVNATSAATWIYSSSGSSVSGSVSSSSVATSITFTVTQGLNDKTAQVTLYSFISGSGGQIVSWSLTLTASGSGGGGGGGGGEIP